MLASAMPESAWSLLDKFGMIEDGKIKNAAAALFIKRPNPDTDSDTTQGLSGKQKEVLAYCIIR